MCSTPGERSSAGSLPTPSSGRHQPGTLDHTLDRLGRAIDELADAARSRDLTAHDVATRVAAVWDMVAQLDPELTRRLAGYRD